MDRLSLNALFRVLRFGNQGAAQAQNLRDSGISNESILIANRADSYAEDAKSKGFVVEHDFAKAAAVADGKRKEYLRAIALHVHSRRWNIDFQTSVVPPHPRPSPTRRV